MKDAIICGNDYTAAVLIRSLYNIGINVPRGLRVGAHNTIYASGFAGNLLCLSANGTKWKVVGKFNEPRFFHRLILLTDGHLLAIGGEGKHGKLRDAEILSP
jgi:photosystem II stability/assembly factor-like uncharacterized protein